MKVKDLIEKLQRADAEAEVYASRLTIFNDVVANGLISAENQFETYPVVQVGEFSNWQTGINGVCFVFDDVLDSPSIDEVKGENFIN